MSIRDFSLWRYLDKKFGIPKDETPRGLPWNFDYTDEVHEYDWDDWQKDMKKKYPIRHFIFHDLTTWASVRYRIWVTDPIYKFKSLHIKKQHLLDLRKGEWNKRGFPLGYEYGYTDPHYVLEMAVYASFINYLEELEANHGSDSWRGEKGLSGLDKCIKDSQEHFDEEDIKEDSDVTKMNKNAKEWLEHYNKIKEIKDFFEELPVLEAKGESMYPPKGITRAEAREYYDKKDAYDKDLKEKTTKKLSEIIELRFGMWT